MRRYIYFFFILFFGDVAFSMSYIAKTSDGNYIFLHYGNVNPDVASTVGKFNDEGLIGAFGDNGVKYFNYKFGDVDGLQNKRILINGSDSTSYGESLDLLMDENGELVAGFGNELPGVLVYNRGFGENSWPLGQHEVGKYPQYRQRIRFPDQDAVLVPYDNGYFSGSSCNSYLASADYRGEINEKFPQPGQVVLEKLCFPNYRYRSLATKTGFLIARGEVWQCNHSIDFYDLKGTKVWSNKVEVCNAKFSSGWVDNIVTSDPYQVIIEYSLAGRLGTNDSRGVKFIAIDPRSGKLIKQFGNHGEVVFDGAGNYSFVSDKGHIGTILGLRDQSTGGVSNSFVVIDKKGRIVSNVDIPSICSLSENSQVESSTPSTLSQDAFYFASRCRLNEGPSQGALRARITKLTPNGFDNTFNKGKGFIDVPYRKLKR